MGDVPATRFARNGDVHIAYQVFGKGSVDLLLVTTGFTTSSCRSASVCTQER